MTYELPRVGTQLDLTISGASVGPYDVTPGATHYWDAVGRGDLQLRKCQECGEFSHPRQEACEHCLSDALVWESVSGAGEVYTFSVVHRAPTPELKVPYTLGFVRLDEGVYLFTEILGEDVRIGSRVSSTFVEEPHGTLVKFEITGEGS